MTNLKDRLSKPSLSDFWAAYPEAKAAQNSAKLWRWAVVGPLAVRIAWLAARLGLSPNQITLLSLIVGLVAATCLAVGEPAIMVVGSVLVIASYLLDCVDGHLARYYHSASPAGKFFDDAGGIIVVALVWVGAGAGLYRHPDIALGSLISTFSREALTSAVDPGIYLFFGCLAALSSQLRGNISVQFNQTVGSIETVGEMSSRPSEKLRRRSFIKRHRWLYWLHRNVTGRGGIMGPLFILSSLFQFMSVVVVLYGILYTVDLAAFLWYSCAKLDIL